MDRWEATSDWRSSSERGARVPTFIICIVMAARVRVKINGAENGKALVVRDGSARSETSVLHGSLRELTPNSLSLNSKGVTVHVPALEGQGCMLLSVSLV